MSDDYKIDELRDDIDQTRDNMGETIEQLEQRLAPERLQQDTSEIVREVADKIIAEFQGKSGDLTQQIADQIQSAVHGAAMSKSEDMLNGLAAQMRTVGTSLWDRVGSSPAPVALAAVGIGLLAAGGRGNGSSSNGTGDASSSGVMGMVDEVLAQANTVAEKVTGAVSGAGDQSSNLLNQAKSKVGDTEVSSSQMQGLVSDQPILAGLLALGLGAAMGLSMSTTEKEREATSSMRATAQDRLGEMGIANTPGGMMAQAKEELGSLAGKVADAASEGMTQAKQTAADLADTAKETAVEAANDRGMTR